MIVNLKIPQVYVNPIHWTNQFVPYRQHCKHSSTLLKFAREKVGPSSPFKKNKFREPHGYKKGVLAAFTKLEKEGLGTIETFTNKFGTASDSTQEDYTFSSYHILN